MLRRFFRDLAREVTDVARRMDENHRQEIERLRLEHERQLMQAREMSEMRYRDAIHRLEAQLSDEREKVQRLEQGLLYLAQSHKPS